jgi:ankyrin repeat protein
MKIRALLCLLLFWGLATGGGARAAITDTTSDLLTAIGSNKPAAARAALEAGAEINADVGEGRTPLISAVFFSRPEIVKMLLERGADPNQRAGDAIIGNAVTAAFFAMNGTQLIGMGDTDAAQHATALEVLNLVAHAKGVDLNLLVRRATTQMSPLMIAADAGAADAVQILLDAGANPNTMNGGNYTALDYAVDRKPGWSAAPASNRVAVVRALLANGARKDRKPKDGVTPAERAKRAGNAEITALLAAR